MASLSYGDASDGDCSWTVSDNNITQSLWNCQDINIPSGVTLKFTGTDPVVLRAQGSVNIAGTIDVSADGTSPGPGGGAPGLASGADAPGSTGGEGLGGANGGLFVNGGGGSGATLINPTSDFPSEVLGGRGGGAGGDGDDGTTVAGGAGGAGGGALSIIAKGAVEIISGSSFDASGAQGADGAVGGVTGGAGGGGAGGAVYILSNISIDFDGSINGAGGPAGTTGTAGTDGVDARIRFDAPDGQRNIGGSTGGITPSEQVPPSVSDPLPGDDTSSGDNVSSLSPELESDIEYACSYREGLPYLPQLVLFFFGFAFTLLMAQALRRR